MLSPRPGATLAEYVEHLRSTGFRVSLGSVGTYWVASGDRVVQRLPTHDVTTPSQSEVDIALRTTGAVIASYLVEPDDYHAANGWLYLCSDRSYTLGTLPPPMQRNVRRGIRELTIAPLEASELLRCGSQAFCDTQRRNGLDDETEMGFRRSFEAAVRRPGQAYLAAWRNDRLAAFATILRIDDWVEVCCFSATSTLWYRPNDALMYVALSTYLPDHRCRVVSYGLSSIQAKSNAAGLHRFKRKVGFAAIPVHRAFVLHPSVRHFAHPFALTAAHTVVNGALHIRPGNLALKKAGGMLACMLGSTSMMPQRERSTTARIPFVVRGLKPQSLTQPG
jgi:hypothetical protein